MMDKNVQSDIKIKAVRQKDANDCQEACIIASHRMPTTFLDLNKKTQTKYVVQIKCTLAGINFSPNMCIHHPARCLFTRSERNPILPFCFQ